MNIDDSTDMIAYGEPFMLGLGAKAELLPVATLDDMQGAMEVMGKMVEKYR